MSGPVARGHCRANDRRGGCRCGWDESAHGSRLGVIEMARNSVRTALGAGDRDGVGRRRRRRHGSGALRRQTLVAALAAAGMTVTAAPSTGSAPSTAGAPSTATEAGKARPTKMVKPDLIVDAASLELDDRRGQRYVFRDVHYALTWQAWTRNAPPKKGSVAKRAGKSTTGLFILRNRKWLRLDQLSVPR